MISLPINFSFVQILLTLTTSVILYFIYNFYLLPLSRIHYYTKQGAVRIFHWKLLAYIDNFRNGVKRGDFYYNYKQVVDKHPKTRVIVENFGPRAYLALVDLEMVKEAWKRHEVYQKDKYPFALIMELAGGTTVFAEEGAWKKGRKVISSAFNFEFLKHIVPMIVEVTQDKFKELIKDQELKDVYLLDKLAAITGEITGRFFFGKRFQERTIFGVPMTTMVHQQLNSLFGEALSLSYILLGPRLVKANILKRHKELNKGIAEIRARCSEMIEETEKSDKKEDNLLGVLLDLRRSGDVQDGMSNDQIVGEFLGLFGAGTDTTSHLVNSAIYFLWKNKEIYEKVKEEVDREFADIENLSIEKINKMEYMTAFLKETLRLGGPTTGFFYRSPVKDDNLCGFHIKKGTIVNFHPDIYYSSEEYFPNHKEFRPERWLEGHEQSALKAEPYAFIPFSAGPRNCVGQHLAMIEARIMIGLFIKTFKFEFPEDYELKLVKRFLYEPLNPLMVTLVPMTVSDNGGDGDKKRDNNLE